MKQDEDLKRQLTKGADAVRINTDEQLERFLRSRSRREAVRRGVTIVVALLVAALGASIAWLARPGGEGRFTPTTPSEPSGTIVYMRIVANGETAEVGSTSAMNPSPTPLGIGRYSIYPVWSRDGSMIAVGSGTDYDSAALTVADADGSHARTLVDQPLRGTMSWSPDGTQIAYIRDGTQGSSVFAVSTDGSDDHEVLPGYWQSVSWSPDGSPLLLAGHPETTTNSYTEENYDIYTIHPDGSVLVPILQRKGFEHFAAWSPDGTKILFTSGPSYDDATYDSDVYVMNADGTDVRQLTSWSGFDSFPTWSPDGDWIAFASDRDATPEQQQANRRDDAFANISIYVMRSDGSDVRELLAADDGETLLPGSWTSVQEPG